MGSRGRWRATAGTETAPIDDVEWTRLCTGASLLRGYTTSELARLRKLTARFLASKSIEGAGGLELDDMTRISIAAQACVPVLNLGLDWYRGWYSIIVYPHGFLARHEYVDDMGVVHEVEQPLSGEAWERGPVILSWDEARDNTRGTVQGNLVIHEFAHKLDLLNGVANGMPPLHREMSRKRWTAVFSAAFADFQRRVDNGEDLSLDEYGAEDPGEFFAVMTEAFFTSPADLIANYPRLYAELKTFYRQDPVSLDLEAADRDNG